MGAIEHVTDANYPQFVVVGSVVEKHSNRFFLFLGHANNVFNYNVGRTLYLR